MAKNQVIAGDYNGKPVSSIFGAVSIGSITISKATVESYETVDENYKKSAVSAVGRAAVGAFLLGPIGLLAGVSAKNKGTHTLAIYLKMAKRVLLKSMMKFIRLL